MSGWHRDHPELAGTDMDPWMAIPSHRAAVNELRAAGHIQLEEDLDGLIPSSRPLCDHEDFEIVDPQDAREAGLGAGDAVCHECGEVRRAADRVREP